MPGDRDLTELIREWQRPIYNLAYRWLGNEADASDAAQEAFVRVLEQLPYYDSSREFRPWLFQVASNSMRNGLRGRKRAKEREREVARSTPSAYDESDLVERAETDAILSGHVAELPDDDRELIALHFYSGLSQREVASVLQIPKSTVQHRVQKCLVALKDRLRAGGHAALVPGLDQALRSAPQVPVPAGLTESLEALAAASISTAAGPATASLAHLTLGGILMSKATTVSLAIAILLAGFLAGRLIPEFNSEDPESTASSSAAANEPSDLARQLAQLEEETAALRKRLMQTEDANKALTHRLSESASSAAPATASTSGDSLGGSATNSSSDPEQINFETLRQLIGENLDILARLASDEDADLTGAERARIMAVQAAALHLIGHVKQISDNPLYDEELGPKIIDMLYGGALELSDEDRSQLQELTRRVQSEFAAELDPDQSSVVERYSNRRDMLAALSSEIEGMLPEDQAEQFEQANMIAQHLTRGRLATYDIGIGPKASPDEFYRQTQKAWTEIYRLEPHQQEPVQKISADLFLRYSEYLSRESKKPGFDASSLEARGEFLRMQTEAERAILALLSEEQYEQSFESRPALLRVNPTGNINISESSGLGF